MNKMEKYQDMYHNFAIEKDTVFMTHGGARVQVFGKMAQRGDELWLEFRIAIVIGE